MAVGSWFYGPLSAAFEAQGWEARVLPRQGFEADGPKASPDHDWSYADETAVLEQAIVESRTQDPDRPVVIVGHSLGGHLGVAAQLGESPADALIIIGTASPHYRHYGLRSLGLLAMGAAVGPAAKFSGYLRKPFFGAPGAKTLMTEWANIIITGDMPYDLSSKVTSPALSIHLQGDSLSVKSAVRMFERNNFEPEALTTWTYLKKDTPEGGSTDHVQWVKHPEPVVDYIVTWWDEHASKRALSQ